MSISNITFIGSIDTSYKRGKDKTKRKSRGLLAAAGLGTIGAKAGSYLGQADVIIKKYMKNYPNEKFTLGERILGYTNQRVKINDIRNAKPKSKYLKILNKARLRGGIKGAAIGTGLGLGAAYLSNKSRNKDKN